MSLCFLENDVGRFGKTTVKIGSFDDIVDSSSSVLLCIDEGVPKSFWGQIPNGSVLCWKTPGGERVKSREVKSELEDFALTHGIGSDACVIVLGGGATLDLVGFFAATFGRGMKLVFLPSTLLSMADSCLGGKNGINVRGIKNAIGTFFHPDLVVVNIALLDSLNDRQMASGCVEVAKHAMLTSEQAVQTVVRRWGTREYGELQELIAGSLRCKGRIVDSLDVERRHILNIGHTVGHALEGLEGVLDHGLGVAIGLFVEATVGFQKGCVSRKVLMAAEKVLELVNPFISLRGTWGLAEFAAILRRDKKNKNGRVHMVFLNEIGELGSVRTEIDDTDVVAAYEVLSRFRRS